jgi:hypothetical protein
MLPLFFVYLFLFGPGATASVPAKSSLVVEYIANLAGSADKWNEYLATCEAIYRDRDNKLWVRPGYMFIYGGNVIDNAPGELAILQDLVPMAERQPEQVRIVLGDRDINKMELRKHGLSSFDIIQYFENVGAPGLFEFHRQQLRERNLRSDAVGVADSLVRLVGRGGLLERYLQLGVLATIVNRTLFVPGSWRNNATAPPWTAQRIGNPSKNTTESIDFLNKWKDKELISWIEDRNSHGRGLLAYQANPSGVIASDQTWLVPQINSKELMRQGVDRIVMSSRGESEFGPLFRERDTVDFIWGDNPNAVRSGVTIIRIHNNNVRIRNNRLLQNESIDVSWNFPLIEDYTGRFHGSSLILGQAKSGAWLVFKPPYFELIKVAKGRFQTRKTDGVLVGHSYGVSNKELARIMSLPEPRDRVQQLLRLDGYFLKPHQIAAMVHQSAKLVDSEEIGQYIRIAFENQKRQFDPMLEAWLKKWTPPAQNWQQVLTNWVAYTLSHKPCEGILSNYLSPDR